MTSCALTFTFYCFSFNGKSIYFTNTTTTQLCNINEYNFNLCLSLFQFFVDLENGTLL